MRLSTNVQKFLGEISKKRRNSGYSHKAPDSRAEQQGGLVVRKREDHTRKRVGDLLLAFFVYEIGWILVL